MEKILKKYFFFHVRALCLLHYFLINFKIIIEEKLQQICRVIGLSRDGPAYAPLLKALLFMKVLNDVTAAQFSVSFFTAGS